MQQAEDLYNVTVGYSPLDEVDADKMRHGIENNKRIIEGFRKITSKDEVLVAGMGNGQEAVEIFKVFKARVTGVDISYKEGDFENQDGLTLIQGDLGDMTFPDNTFDFVYSSHVLEHVPDHMKVLKEIYRVMKKGGVLFIGFPNRHRVLGYVSSHQKISLGEKIKWNYNDWKLKLKGKFHNNLGAHAGFSEKEFLKDAGKFFNEIHPVRDKYMLYKHMKYAPAIKLLTGTGLSEIIFPSNYYICIKN